MVEVNVQRRVVLRSLLLNATSAGRPVGLRVRQRGSDGVDVARLKRTDERGDVADVGPDDAVDTVARDELVTEDFLPDLLVPEPVVGVFFDLELSALLPVDELERTG